MREYLEWQLAEGRVRVRIHRRVLAGLEHEEAAEFRGLLLGTASPGTYEVLVEDYAQLTPGANSLPAVGYFRVAQGRAELSDADRETFLSRFEDPLSVLLLLERSAEGISPAQLLLRSGAEPERELAVKAASAAPGHRVLFREGLPEQGAVESEPADRSARRFLWPVVAIAAGLATGVVGYLALSGDTRTQENRAAKRIDPMPAPPPGEAPVAAPTREALPSQQADRAMDPTKPLTRADRAEVQRQIREVLNRWRESLLKGDLETHASVYASSVGPYFTRNQVSRAQIADEVKQMLKRYGAVTTYKISDVTISPSDANHAIANFRKLWGTAGRKFAGEEREQLKFVREGSDWLIASEQELKVYWVRKK
jgi:hypothetical protein